MAEEATTRRVTRDLFASHTVDQLRAHSDYWLGQQGRLTEPMWLAPGADHYEPISWDAAFALMARTLADLDHPDQAAFYTSGRTSNEAAFLYQLFVRALGTNNLPDCSNMCHESSGAALSETIGVGKGSVSLDDFHQADLILVVGPEPGHQPSPDADRAGAGQAQRCPHHRRQPAARGRADGLRATRRRPRGLVGCGHALADLFLQVRLNGDLALFQALNRLLVERDADHPGASTTPSSSDHCDGFEALVEHLRGHRRGPSCSRPPGWNGHRSPRPPSWWRDRRAPSCAGRWA